MNTEKEIAVLKKTVPLTFADIDEIFSIESEGKSVLLLVDHQNSRFSNEEILSFLGNFDIKSDILFDSTATAFSMLKEYMTLVRMIKIPSLIRLMKLCVEIVVNVVENPEQYSPEEFLMAKDFITKEAELFALWHCFYQSLFLFMMSVNRKNLPFFDLTTTCLAIKDRTCIGPNIAQLISEPNFVDNILTSNVPSTPCYFEIQFQQPVFGGHDLYHHMMYSDSIVFATYIAISEASEEKNEELIHLLNKIKEIALYENSLLKNNEQM